MPQFDAGTAALRIKPSFRGFVEETRSKLQEMDFSVDVRMGIDTATARTELEEFRRVARENVTFHVDANTRVAADEIALLRREASRNATMRIEANTAAAMAEIEALREAARRNSGTLTPRVNGTSARSDASKIAGELKSVLTLQGKVLGIVGAAGAVSDLLAIAGAAAKASHALALIPAVGFGGLAGIGSVAAGAHGISGAFKAFSEKSSNSASDAGEAIDKANAVSEAQYSVEQADRAATTAQKELNESYKDAGRELRDLNDQLQDQKLSTEDAALGVEEAAKRLAQVQHDPSADADTRKRADLSYRQAVQRLKEQQEKTSDLSRDTAEANAKGIEGSDKVTAAKQKVTDATHAQAKAQEDLAKAIRDQAKGSSGDQALAKAMDKLSPNAKELVNDVHALGPAWKDAQQAGQDALTNGLGASITTLAKQQLPNLKTGMVGINTAINSGLRASIAELSSETNKADFKTSLGNVAVGFSNAAKGAAPLTDALTKLVTVGTDFLPKAGSDFAKFAAEFNKKIQIGAANGSLKAWIQEGIDAAKTFLGIIRDAGSVVASVFRAADADGVSKSLKSASDNFAGFLKSAQGQSKLRDFFTEARQDLDKIKPVLADLPGLLSGVYQGFQTWSAIAMPFLKAAGDLLSAHPTLVAGAVAAYVGFKTVKPLVDGASFALDTLAARAGSTGATGLGRFKAAGSGLLGLLGSPWTIGLAVAGTAVLSFMDVADKGRDALSRFREQVAQTAEDNRTITRALQSSGGSLDTGVLDAQSQAVKDLRDQWKQNANDIPGLKDKASASLMGALGSPFGIGSGAADATALRETVGRDSQAAADALDRLGLSNDQLVAKINGDKGGFDTMIGQLKGMGGGGADAASKLEGLRGTWGLNAAAIRPVADAIANLGDKNRDAATAIDAATNALERQQKNALTLEDAQLRVNEALGTLHDNATSAQGAVIGADGSVDTMTKSGQALYRLLNDQLRPAWEQATTATYNHAIQSGKTAKEAEQAAKEQSDAIKNSASQAIQSMGYSQTQADTLLTHYNQLAGDWKANFTLDTSPAEAAVNKFKKTLDNLQNNGKGIPFFLQLDAANSGALPSSYYPQVVQNETPQQVQANDQGAKDQPQAPATDQPKPQKSDLLPWLLGTHSTGGQLPTSGPGTSTRDGFLGISSAGMPIARVDAGEWIINRDSSVKYGKELAAINAGTFPSLKGFKDGGVAGDDSQQPAGDGQQTGDDNTDDTKKDDKKKTTSHVASLISYAQTADGHAYGGAWDCSGFQSKLANVSVGQDADTGRFSTANEGSYLSALGFKDGVGNSSTFRIGWVNNPNMASGGHTAGTLPNGVNVESGGATSKVMYGGLAIGAADNMFTNRSYLVMDSAGGTGAYQPGQSTPGATTYNPSTSTVTNPQAALPGRVSDTQISIEEDKAAVDTANSERNAVYANPASTDADKHAADRKYQKAQNALESAQKKDDDSSLSLNGIFSKAGGYIADALLSGLGLEKSILGKENIYNKAAVSIFDHYKDSSATGGYSYTPQNLPTVVTTSTPQSDAPVSDPALVDQPPESDSTTIGKASHAAAVEKWRPVFKSVLSGLGKPASWLEPGLSQMESESGGDDHAINDHDSDGQGGIQTVKGLMQMRDDTYAAYRSAQYGGGIFNGASNIAASILYTAARYGDATTVWGQGHGYADGGSIVDGLIRGAGGGRGDGVPIWASPNEFVVNAYDAVRNQDALEAINAGRWSPVNLDPSQLRSSSQTTNTGPTHNTTVNARVADVRDLADLVERQAHIKSMGQLAAIG